MTVETDVLLILAHVLHWAVWNTFAHTVNTLWALAWFCVPGCAGNGLVLLLAVRLYV